MIEEILEYNRDFVEQNKYEPYRTSKYPNKKLAIITCMDTRLTELLPAALGLKNGDAKIIKNAGGVISHPFGSAVRSILIAIYELGVTEVMVVGHTDCGVQHMDFNEITAKMREQGVKEEHMELIQDCGVNLERWLTGFDDAGEAVKASVSLLKRHPMVPKSVIINGYIMDSVTGQLVEC